MSAFGIDSGRITANSDHTAQHSPNHWSVAWRPSVMKRKPHLRRKRTTTKSVLRVPDLEHAKAAVLNSLTSLDAQRGYRHAIDEFVDWYCSELAWLSTEL